MGVPVPPPPPEWMGGPSASGEWKSEEAKRDYVRMLEAHVVASPPRWLLVVLIVAVIAFGAAMVWSLMTETWTT